MGFFSDILGAAAPIVGGIFGGPIGGAIGGAVGGLLGGGGSSQSGTATATTQQQMDPRIADILFGSGRKLNPGVTPTYGATADGTFGLTNPDSDYTGQSGGLLDKYLALGAQPQNPAMAGYGQAAGNYLTTNGATDLERMRAAAGGLLSGGMTAPTMKSTNAAATPGMDAATVVAPTKMATTKIAAPDAMSAATMAAPDAMSAATMAAPTNMTAASVRQAPTMSAATAQASQVNAPSQNNLDLSSAYDRMINGNAGANPYLTSAIQGGIDQSKNAFGQMQDDSMRNLMQTILPSIRGGAVAAGQYGGSRQGIAEGNALGDFAREQQRAITQYGQANTNAAVGAQASAFDAGQNRSLSAMTGLGAQQYGVAAQNSAQEQQANLANTNFQQQANANNAGFTQQNNLADAGFQQQAGQTNYGGLLSAAQTNAGLQQQAAQTNYQGQLSTAQTNAGFTQQANTNNYQGALNVAGQNANLQNQANATNYQGLLGIAGQNANLQNQANATNYQGMLGVNQFNAASQNQAGAANLQSQLGTNSLNSNNTQSGLGALNGLLGNAYTTAGNQDSYALNQAGKVNGLLAPYIGLNGTTTNSQPLYQNQAGNILGGATAGLGLANSLGGLLGGGGGGNVASGLLSNPFDMNQAFGQVF